MKQFLKYILVFVLALICLLACKKEPQIDVAQQLEGTWELSNVEFTKSAQIGSETISIYLQLQEEGKFDLYQKLGYGRFVRYSGTWIYMDGVLSGKYSDGKSWASSYNVDLQGDNLTLTTVSTAEVHSYKRCDLPLELR